MSPICIHLSSLPAYKASALLCSCLWHLECYKFNVCLHFILFSLPLSTKEILALAWINPVTSRSKLTGDFQAWTTQLDQVTSDGGKKIINGASVKKKQHCHPLQHDSKGNTNKKQLKLPQGTSEGNTEAGMMSSHPLLLHPCWGSRSWCQHPGEKHASEQLQAEQLSNSASLCASLGGTGHHTSECGDTGYRTTSMEAVHVFSGNVWRSQAPKRDSQEPLCKSLRYCNTQYKHQIKFCKSGQTPKALEFGWTQSSLILPLTLSFPCRLNQKVQIIPGCSFPCCPYSDIFFLLRWDRWNKRNESRVSLVSVEGSSLTNQEMAKSS